MSVSFVAQEENINILVILVTNHKCMVFRVGYVCEFRWPIHVNVKTG